VQRDRCVGLAVQVQLGPQIVAGQDIAVQHHDRVIRPAAQPGSRVPDPAAGAQRLLLVHVVDLESEPGSVAEAFGEHRRPVSGREHYPGHPAGRGPGELVGEERHARGGQQRLGDRDGQRSQPGTPAADQDNGFERLAAAWSA